jgi:hypothetical protein
MKLVSLFQLNTIPSDAYLLRGCFFSIKFKFIIAALLAVASAAPSGYKPEYKAPEIAIVAQSDVRNVDGSGAWR